MKGFRILNTLCFIRLYSNTMFDKAKKAAGYLAVDNHVADGMIVGIGSGSTIVHSVKRLQQRVSENNLSIKCVPSSFQARQLIIEHDLDLSDLERTPELDICIDGADEVDSNLNLIKGGGGCLLQEKIVASCSKEVIIVADYTKDSTKLGEQYTKGIPLEVSPLAWLPVKCKIERRYGGECVLRQAAKKAGPVVTDNGNFLLDWVHFNKDSDWKEVNKELIQIPGLIETGLFIDMATKVYFGQKEGTVKERSK